MLQGCRRAATKCHDEHESSCVLADLSHSISLRPCGRLAHCVACGCSEAWRLRSVASSATTGPLLPRVHKGRRAEAMVPVGPGADKDEVGGFTGSHEVSRRHGLEALGAGTPSSMGVEIGDQVITRDTKDSWCFGCREQVERQLGARSTTRPSPPQPRAQQDAPSSPPRTLSQASEGRRRSRTTGANKKAGHSPGRNLAGPGALGRARHGRDVCAFASAPTRYEVRFAQLLGDDAVRIHRAIGSMQEVASETCESKITIDVRKVSWYRLKWFVCRQLSPESGVFDNCPMRESGLRG